MARGGVQTEWCTVPKPDECHNTTQKRRRKREKEREREREERK